MMDYKKFRWFFTSRGFVVVGGKNQEQNEQLIKKYLDKKDIVLHTKAPGSPFCVIKASRKKISGRDIKEAAIFCACFSQQWKKRKKQVEIHIFKSEQIFKEKRQKTGTFSILGKVQKTKVKPILWLGVQKNELRAAPISCFKEPLLKILPGRVSKEKVILEIRKRLEKKRLAFSKEEIAKAIPSGGFSV